MGFLPNGDLILVDGLKIYLYSLKDKSALWEHSQIYNLVLTRHNFIGSIVRQTKLFLYNDGLMTQWDLLTMTLEMHYDNPAIGFIEINKNQTLLASLNMVSIDIVSIDIYSMETGMRISRYG